MNLEQFLSERLSKEELEVLNIDSKIDKVKEDKKDNKLIITLPKEIVHMINSDDKGKKILKDNVIRYYWKIILEAIPLATYIKMQFIVM